MPGRVSRKISVFFSYESLIGISNDSEQCPSFFSQECCHPVKGRNEGLSSLFPNPVGGCFKKFQSFLAHCPFRGTLLRDPLLLIIRVLERREIFRYRQRRNNMVTVGRRRQTSPPGRGSSCGSSGRCLCRATGIYFGAISRKLRRD